MAPTDKPGATLRFEPDAIIGERYRVVELLGEGGMGVVYRVEHTHMRKLFALKVLHRVMLQMPEAVARFEREAVLAGSINHPNVAAATDFGKLPDGSFFLVLELVVGKSLRELLAEIAAGAHDPVRALGIMRGMAAGVAAAHAKGIVHRDLKPDNVMLVERDGVPDFVKVLDFGIAKGNAMPEARASESKSADESSPKALTQIGMIMGTPAYMSPEQALGQDVDVRSDLYSLGVIYFELLAGAPPFQADDALQILRHHLLTEAPPVPADRVADVAVPLAEIVKKLLAKEPKDRFQTAAELLAALEGPASIARIKVAPVAAAPLPIAEPAAERTKAEAPPAPSSDAALSDRDDAKMPPRRVVIGAASLGLLVLLAIVVVILTGRSDPANAGMVQSAESAAGSASAGPDDDPGPVPTPIASASPDDSEPETPEVAPSAAPVATGAPPSSPAATGRAGRGRRGRPGRQAQPKKPGVLQPLKDLFN